MAIRIVTDSASDYTPEEGKKLGITIIPMTLLWDGVEYRDAVDMNNDQFFDRLVNSSTIPTTSQVSPVAFESVYEELTANGDQLIVITISSKLSGTCQSAMIAAEDYEGKVFVVDSLNATVGEHVLIETAMEYIEQGLGIEEIVAKLEYDRTRIRLLASLDTMEFLKKGGRISAAVAFAGGLLSIKPVITIEDGAIMLLGKARGSKNANNLLRKYVEEMGGIDFRRPFRLIYSGNSDELLQQYIENSKDMWESKVEELPIMRLGAVIGTHIGPGAVGVAFYES
ncbi:MAG: DegV family protein [Lachnospiraceae bacterium]|nr:DegV family protein [Lachnospiraceae bacterium]